MYVHSHGTFIWENICFVLCSSITQYLENSLLYILSAQNCLSDFISEHYPQHVNEHKLPSKADFYVSWFEGRKEYKGLEASLGSVIVLVF